MKIVLTNVKPDDHGPVKRALKREIKPFPAVSVKNGGGSVIEVKVTNGPKEKDGREKIAANVDTILARHGYKFCNVNHGN